MLQIFAISEHNNQSHSTNTSLLGEYDSTEDVERLDRSPLIHKLVITNHYNILRCIVDSNLLNVNTQGAYGKPPLYYAIREYHVKCFKLLLSHKDIHVNIRDHNGNTPLHSAVAFGRIDFVQLLLEVNSIDVNA